MTATVGKWLGVAGIGRGASGVVVEVGLEGAVSAGMSGHGQTTGMLVAWVYSQSCGNPLWIARAPLYQQSWQIPRYSTKRHGLAEAGML